MNAPRLLTQVVQAIPWPLRSRIQRIPGIAQLQRLLVSALIDGEEFDHRVDAGPAKGVTFRIRMPEDKGIWTGTYENAFASKLAAAVIPGTVAFDIGSWHGFFAGVMAAQGASEVHVFEPLPANQERLQHLVELNPGLKITLHSCALGDRDTEMDLVVMPETSMAKLQSSSFQSTVQPRFRVQVPVRSLDSMIAREALPPPSLMKIDVEGAEVMVLRGAVGVLRRSRPELFIEVHSSALLTDCRNLLESEGYSVLLADPDPLAATARDVFQVYANPVRK